MSSETCPKRRDARPDPLFPVLQRDPFPCNGVALNHMLQFERAAVESAEQPADKNRDWGELKQVVTEQNAPAAKLRRRPENRGTSENKSTDVG